MTIGQSAPTSEVARFAHELAEMRRRIGDLERVVGQPRTPSTWSPGARNAGRADVTVTIDLARYVVRDGWCDAVADVNITSNSAGTGAIRIDLPVAAAMGGIVIGTMQFSDASATTSYHGFAFVAGGTSQLQVEGYRDNVSPVAAMASTLGTGDIVRVQLSYPVA